MQDLEDQPLFAEQVAGLGIAKAVAEVSTGRPATPRRAVSSLTGSHGLLADRGVVCP
jgi:hypothetical protein